MGFGEILKRGYPKTRLSCQVVVKLLLLMVASTAEPCQALSLELCIAHPFQSDTFWMRSSLPVWVFFGCSCEILHIHFNSKILPMDMACYSPETTTVSSFATVTLGNNPGSLAGRRHHGHRGFPRSSK